MNEITEYLLREELDGPAPPAAANGSTPAPTETSDPSSTKALDPELVKVLERLMQPDVLRALSQLLRAR